jgi:hypothetical protein
MTEGDFFERTEVLAEMVGDGMLSGEFQVEKVYAAVQHEKGWRNYLGFMGTKDIEVYHRGGGPKFVEEPLKENYARYYQDLADGVLSGTVREKMVDAMEDQDRELQVRAPERDGELKRAGAYTVRDGDSGAVFARKEPETPYEVEDPGNPPGFVIGYLKRAGKL